MKLLYIGNDFAKGGYNSSMNTLSNSFEKESIDIIRTSSKSNRIIRMLDMLINIWKYRSNVSYTIIDTFSTFSFFYALICSQFLRLLQKKYILILRGGNLPQRLENNKIMTKLLFKNSYLNVAPSNYLLEAFKEYGYNSVFIPNILEIDLYKFKERKIFKPKLLWVRAFDNIYNPTLAIKVLNNLKTIYKDAKLCMVGPVKDDSFNEVKDLVSRLNLQESVVFTGVLPKEEWHKLSQNYDIFINTTNIDNTPVSVMEAMALGLPIISTNVGGLPYLIEHKTNGVLVKKNNAEVMSNAVVEIINNINQSTEMVQNARLKAESFSWANVRLKWIGLLSEHRDLMS